MSILIEGKKRKDQGMKNNKPTLIRAKQDYCGKCDRWTDTYFEFEQKSKKCLFCDGQLICIDKVLEIPSALKEILKIHKPDIEKLIIS